MGASPWVRAKSIAPTSLGGSPSIRMLSDRSSTVDQERSTRGSATAATPPFVSVTYASPAEAHKTQPPTQASVMA